MKSYCFKCKKGTENINPRVSSSSKTSSGKTMLLSNAQNVVLKNQDLLKIKKRKDY